MRRVILTCVFVGEGNLSHMGSTRVHALETNQQAGSIEGEITYVLGDNDDCSTPV